MRRLAFAAVILLAVPSLSLAADTAPAAPPSPPPVSYDVWGFVWNGQQYVKQDTHSYSTFDVTKAQGYADQINSFAGWSAATNIPESAVVHKVYQGPGVTNVRPGSFPSPLTYSVWAYKLTDGKWAKDASYSWTTQDPQLGLDYAQKVIAVPGWTATTNCPATVPAERRVCRWRHGSWRDELHQPLHQSLRQPLQPQPRSQDSASAPMDRRSTCRGSTWRSGFRRERIGTSTRTARTSMILRTKSKNRSISKTESTTRSTCKTKSPRKTCSTSSR